MMLNSLGTLTTIISIWR